MNTWQRLMRLAYEQHGVFSLSQAIALGLAARTLRDRIEAQGWERLHNGVYLLPGAVPTYEQATMAALLAVRPGRPSMERNVLVAGRSAARLWGMTEARPQPVQLIAPFEGSATRRGAIYVIRSRTILEADAASIGPLDLTTPARTVIDLARYAGRDELFEVASMGMQLGLLDPDKVAARLVELLRPPGRSKLHWLLAELSRHGKTDSTFERDVRCWLCDNGFQPYPGVYPLRVEGRLIAMLDIAFLREQVYVEIDGRRFHSDRRAFRHDRVRNNEIAAIGWLGLRLSRDEFEQAPERFLVQLGRTLGARRVA